MDLEGVAHAVVDSSYKVHKALGPGLLEKIYETCLCHELMKAGYKVERQVNVPVKYNGMIFDEGYRLDLLVENQIICEIKAAEKHNTVWEAQLLRYCPSTVRHPCAELGYRTNPARQEVLLNFWNATN